jgi:hypothetical protein
MGGSLIKRGLHNNMTYHIWWFLPADVAIVRAEHELRRTAQIRTLLGLAARHERKGTLELGATSNKKRW